MKVPFNDLARLNNNVRADIMDAVKRVITSPFVVLGPELEKFEDWLTCHTGKSGTVGVGNGTDALEISFRVLASEDRRIIVTQANAGGYSSIAALRAGLEVQYCDLNESGKSFDISHLREILNRLGNKIAAIVVTHLYGIVHDPAELISLADEFQIPLVEDCAQAIGVTTGAGNAGSFGDVACFSFYPTKNLGALGDGGAASFADEVHFRKARKLREYGWSEKYHITLEGGRNSRLDEVQAAILNVKTKFLDTWNSERLSTHNLYSRELETSPFLSFVAEATDYHNAHLEVVKLDPGLRDKFVEHMRRQGVDCKIHYPICDHKQAIFKSGPVSLRRSEKLTSQVVSLPNFPHMTLAEKHQVIDAALQFGSRKVGEL